MLAKILGVLDLIVAAVFFVNNTFDKSDSWFPDKIVLIMGIYLLIKGILFLLTIDFASSLDVIASIIIIISAWVTIPLILAIIVLIFLVQKGLLSLLS